MDDIINNEPDIEALPDSNSIQFLEQMYESFLANPSSLDSYWSSYFKKISEHFEKTHTQKIQLKPSWFRKDWPPTDSTDEIAAFDGQWQKTELNLI